MTGQLIEDMPEADYHAHPALSVSGAKKLLPPSCPALYKYERDNGPQRKQAFDVGHAAHGLVLGVGEPVVVIDAPDYRGKAAREERDAAYAENRVPVLASEWEAVQGMAAAIKAHPRAGELFAPGRGVAERSAFWTDEQFGVERRARFDWLIGSAIVDYKTAVAVDRASIAKSVASYRYHMQADWYREAARACGLIDDALFVFVFQAKTPPYLVSVVEIDAQALEMGRALNEKALRTFADCTAADHWPGFSDDVEVITLPRWATYEFQEIAS